MAKAKGSKQGRSIPDSSRKYAKLLISKGFTLTLTGRTHYKVTHPHHPGWSAFIASSGSDHRGTMNSIAAIRRATGIDVTR